MSESIEKLIIDKKEIIPAKLEQSGAENESAIKTPEDLAQLAETRIADASSIADNLESGGEKRLEEIKDSVKISEGKFDDSVVKSGMEKIKARAKTLFETLKAKLKMAGAIGMAAMAFSGAGDFEKAKGGGEYNGETEIESLEKLKQSAQTEKEKLAIENFEKILKESQASIQKTDEAVRMGEIKRKGDPKVDSEKIRNELKKHIESNEYLEKLVIEFGGDIQKAEKIQKERLNYLDTAKAYFKDDINTLFPLIYGDDFAAHVPKWFADGVHYIQGVDGVGAFYDPLRHNVVLPNARDDRSARHEFLHASTKANSGITRKAIEILEDSYKKIGTKEDRYYNDPTEQLVRKQELDLEMERLGIKKYEEEFIDGHYKKLVELDKENKLSMNAHDFMRTTKPEYFKQIFNEIAANESVEDDPVKQA